MKAAVARSNTRLRFIFGLKVKSKLSSVLCGSRKAACFRRRSSRRSLRPVQLVCDQTRDQINRRHGLGLGLVQSSFQHGGDATEPELS
jgi:hypothetical protein